jgi:IS30 family transposase
MIACCSDYLAGGELKAQEKRRRRRRRRTALWTRSAELCEMMSKKTDARFSPSRLCVKRHREKEKKE